jgi:hypothetical protein
VFSCLVVSSPPFLPPKTSQSLFCSLVDCFLDSKTYHRFNESVLLAKGISKYKQDIKMFTFILSCYPISKLDNWGSKVQWNGFKSWFHPLLWDDLGIPMDLSIFTSKLEIIMIK